MWISRLTLDHDDWPINERSYAEWLIRTSFCPKGAAPADESVAELWELVGGELGPESGLLLLNIVSTKTNKQTSYNNVIW